MKNLIFFSYNIGVIMQEWKKVSPATYRTLITALIFLVLAFVVMTWGSVRGESKSEKQQVQYHNSDIVSLVSLLNEMTRRESLSEIPLHELKQVSSFDRTQKGPKDPDTWFNNKDYGYYVRKEVTKDRTEYVIMDETGPGCIVRWWIPMENTYRNCIVRIYLDGKSEPVIEENYHDFISGRSFIKEPFAFISSDEKDSTLQAGLPIGHPKQMGADLYFPIPYSTRCKITLDDYPFFYVINYRSYKPQIVVESFDFEAFEAAGPEIEQTAKQLLHPELEGPYLQKQGIVESNQVMVLDLPSGENAVRSLQLHLDPDVTKEALRTCVLQIDFDDHETVWCPVSEFFGSGVYIRSVSNWNNCVGSDGELLSKWFMPYKKSASIRIRNYGSESLTIALSVSTTVHHWHNQALYFHANWHEEAPINTSSPRDWNYIEIDGEGIYAGDVLTVHSFTKGWWGEGDEKIYVDGEQFPSQLGTGLEDYYGFAWGMAHEFSSPFISIPQRDARGKGDWRGYTTISRMRLLDGIPFHNSLKVDVEAWLHDSSVSYTVATFWYGTAKSTCNRPHEERSIMRNLPGYSKEDIIESPGKKYADPSIKGLISPEGNGSIKQVGNHLDLLECNYRNSSKPEFPNDDTTYGSAGYYFFSGRRLHTRSIQFIKDSVNSPPVYITSIRRDGKGYYAIQDAWFEHPELPDNYLITGAQELNCATGRENEIIEFIVNEKVPDAFRLGILLDNLDKFIESGIFIRITSSNDGDSGLIPLARSNRLPDLYFFDIIGLKPGDKLGIGGYCEDIENAYLAVGGLTFDPLK